MTTELKAVAQFANTDLETAVASTRTHPLWEEEIHIEEELINLQEAFETHAAADQSLARYPQMRRYLLREQRNILRHCIGLIARMQKGRRLPRQYDQQDTEYALTKLIRLLVGEALRVNMQIDDEIMEILSPFLTLRQRLQLGEWKSFSLRLHLQMFTYRVAALWQGSNS